MFPSPTGAEQWAFHTAQHGAPLPVLPLTCSVCRREGQGDGPHGGGGTGPGQHRASSHWRGGVETSALSALSPLLPPAPQHLPNLCESPGPPKVTQCPCLPTSSLPLPAPSGLTAPCLCCPDSHRFPSHPHPSPRRKCPKSSAMSPPSILGFPVLLQEPLGRLHTAWDPEGPGAAFGGTRGFRERLCFQKQTLVSSWWLLPRSESCCCHVLWVRGARIEGLLCIMFFP